MLVIAKIFFRSGECSTTSASHRTILTAIDLLPLTHLSDYHSFFSPHACTAVGASPTEVVSTCSAVTPSGETGTRIRPRPVPGSILCGSIPSPRTQTSSGASPLFHIPAGTFLSLSRAACRTNFVRIFCDSLHLINRFLVGTPYSKPSSIFAVGFFNWWRHLYLPHLPKSRWDLEDVAVKKMV